MITVSIYDANGAALRWRGGLAGRQVFDLRFSSGLPGGFLEASFGLPRAAARLAGVEAGQRVEIRRGSRIVWTGWAEDVRKRQRGGIDAMAVQCFGPYQVLQQRLIAEVDYSADQQGSDAIRQELLANCPEISSDYTQIQATNVAIGPLAKSYMPVGDVVNAVLDAGNSAGKRMLFAIWEPPPTIAASDQLHARNVLLNSDFEGPDWYGWIVDDYSNGDYEITGSGYLSAFHAGKVFSTSAVATGYVELRNAFVAVSPSTPYQFDYSFYWPAVSGITAQVAVHWFTSASVLISVSTGTLWTSAGTAGWNSKTEYVTSPATAAFCIVYLTANWPAGLTNYLLWDDCYLSQQISAATRDGLPRAWLWPRDLSGYDYLLHTHLLEMDPFKFEQLVKLLLEEMGYENVATTSPTNDKGVDVVGTIELGISAVREVIQIKRHRGTIGRPVLDQLRGSLYRFNAVRGTVITTGRFSKGAEDAAFERGAPPITLIDGERLLDLLFDYQIGVNKKQVDYYEFASDKLNQFVTDNGEG